MKRKSIDIVEFLLWFGIVILINIIVSQYFFRVDLTEDKRYTISETSKKILENMKDVAYVEVYLTGAQLTPDYKRLERSVREMLDEFRVYAGNRIQYKFIDPNEDMDKERKSRFYNTLQSKGIEPISVPVNEGVIYIFPVASIVYNEKEVPVQLLKGSKELGGAEMINQSIENLEYGFISGIKQLSLKSKKTLAFVEGHGEYEPISLIDFARSLSSFYNIIRLDLNKVNTLDNYDALIIARPETKYSEEEKYKIDQYVMNGGKVLFYLDAVRVNMDSIRTGGTVALAYQNNLEDLLFKYGVKVNENLVQDMQCAQIPVYVGQMAGRPDIRQVPWFYYPVLNNFGNYPVVKNIGVIFSKFISTIDTVKAPGVNKIPLVFTSKNAKTFSAPLRVDLNVARQQPDPNEFNKGPLPVAYLLEGNFTSLYKNRPLPVQDSSFKANGKKAQVFVCADADIIKNGFRKNKGQLQEVPLEQGNRDFAINVIDYMLDEQGLINIRSKEITLRPLDKMELKENKLMWQIINLVIPVILILAFGISRYYLRKKKYESFK